MSVYASPSSPISYRVLLAIPLVGLVAAFIASVAVGYAPLDVIGATRDALALFDRIGLRENLTPQRSNGLRSMVERIRTEAAAALDSAA